MSDETLTLVEKEMVRTLEAMQKLEPGSKEHSAALTCYFKLATSMNADAKTRGEISRIVSEIDRNDLLLENESRKLDIEEDKVRLERTKQAISSEIESKKLEVEKAKVAVDAERNKIEQKKSRGELIKAGLESAIKGAGLAAMFICVDRVTDADLSGDYISKPAFSMLPKFHL